MNPFKFLTIVLLLLVFESNTSAQNKTSVQTSENELVWLDWNEGYEKALKTGKIVLVDAYTDWCGWCKRMDRDTYSQPLVIAKINADFIPIKFNPELADKTYKIGTETYSAADLYGLLTQGRSTGFPTIYYIFPAKKRIMLDPGYKDPESFLKVLDQIIEERKK